MSVTLKDIAKQAKVSIQTVSQVITNSPDVNEKTRAKIWEIAKKLNYQPNLAARKLARMKNANKTNVKTKNIGCVIFSSYPKFSDIFFNKVLEGIDSETIRQNYHLIFTYTFKDLENKSLFHEMINSQMIDGLILIIKTDKDTVLMFKKSINHIVMVDHWYDSSEINIKERIDYIVSDKTAGIANAVKYLYNLGHHKIGFISGFMKFHGRISERYEGYRKGLKECNLEYDKNLVAEGDFNVDKAYIATKKILNANPAPTAICVASDYMTIGVTKAIKEKGLNIPDDISITGFDDIETASHTVPPLTTVRVSGEDMGKIAVRRLIERINGDSSLSMKIVLPTELIIRQSCREIQGKKNNV